jgi:lipid-A-disaccharide synthase
LASVLLSCGESSGDMYAGALTRELRALAPGISVRGLGGRRFKEAGGECLEDYEGLSVNGFTDIVAKLPRFRRTMARLVAAAREQRVDALVVIDFFGFNSRLARQVKQLGVPVIYYVSPQIWAWRGGRLKTIKELVDRVLVIFPFEEAIYRDAGVPVEFVGHPLVDIVPTSGAAKLFLKSVDLSPDLPTVAILPGSRPKEVRRILPDLLDAAKRIRERVPDVQFVIARAPTLRDELFDPVRQLTASMAVVTGATDDVLAAADVALTASGTATVQAALHDTPMVVVYRVSALDYRIFKPFLTVDTYAMVNLIAGERIVPELIQEAFTPQAVADEAISLLTDRARAARMREGLARVRASLGGPGASRRAAQSILQVIEITGDREVSDPSPTPLRPLSDPRARKA